MTFEPLFILSQQVWYLVDIFAQEYIKGLWCHNLKGLEARKRLHKYIDIFS